MAWEGKRLNLREEEKYLDDKLMELGLLEPGMSLDEKRELASVLLESARMAQEQLSQREKEEEWELMILSEEDTKDRAGTSKGKVQADKDNVSSLDKNRVSSIGLKSTNSHRNMSYIQKEDGIGNETGREKDNTREKTETEQLATVIREKKDRDMIMKREKRDRQRKAEEEARKERQLKGKEEERERRQRERRKGDYRATKDVIVIDDEKEEMEPKVPEKLLCLSEEVEKSEVECKKEKGEISKNSFYGPSHLRETSSPNPFSTEIYGTTAKRCPPKNNNLLKLVEEDMRNKLAEGAIKEKDSKENEQNLKTRERRSTAVEETSNYKKADVITTGQHCSNKSLGKGRRQKDIKGEDKESVSKDDRLAIFPKRELESAKDGNRTRTRQMLSLALSGVSVMKTQEEDVSCEKRRREEESNDSYSATLDFEKREKTSNDERKTPDEKKRKLENGQLSKNWADIAAGRNNLPEKSDEEKNFGETKSKKQMPNKRWRRVKRNFESSFGSGSEVDEWISDNEEKVEPRLLTKDQIVARFDRNLLRIKNALQKKQSSELQDNSKRIKNHVCLRNKYKVPPGFQEPDSDDDCNLWKICFGDKLASVSKSENEEVKAESKSASASKTIVTRSSARQRNSVSPSLSSKSVSSVEEHSATSPLRLSPLKEMLPGPSTQPNDEGQSTSKSPSLKEMALINKVAFPTCTISRSTQTPRDSDTESEHSSSMSTSTAPPSTKIKEVTEACKPMWDLFEVEEEKKNDEVELVDLSSGDGSKTDSVNCPICNQAFPMAEIEAHASVCNAEEEDSSDGEPFTDARERGDNLRSHRMLSKATGAGICTVSNQNTMEILEETTGDSSHEEESDFQPRPARLAPFIPISQQKDSYINYHDQFPEISSNANLQASLARIRKKLMRAGTKKRGWKRRKKGRSKRISKK